MLGAIITGVLRRSAWLVLIVGFAMILTYMLDEDGDPTVLPHVVVGNRRGTARRLTRADHARGAGPHAAIGAPGTKMLGTRIVLVIGGVLFGLLTAGSVR